VRKDYGLGRRYLTGATSFLFKVDEDHFGLMGEKTLRRFIATSLSFGVLALAACSSSQGFKDAANSTPFVMDQWEHVAQQRPNLPMTESLAWTPNDRLYHSVTVDFVEGMSQRSYLFSKPNQAVYKPMLEAALERSGLLARTPAEARYALQVSFVELDANGIGLDFAGQSRAVYKIVNRRTGEVVFNTSVEARFLAIHPRLNEADFALAFDISKPGVVAAADAYATYALTEGLLVELINNNDNLTEFFDGPIDEATQATWTDVQQAYVWTTGLSLLAGPLVVLLDQLDPTNYLAFASGNEMDDRELRGARQGYLSEQGFSSRDGGERARQASTKMLGQSITKFVMDLGRSEGVRFHVLLPCTANKEVEDLKHEIMLQGHGFRTEGCTERRDSRARGLDYTTWK
jgi:hypothetical protein